MEFNIHPLTNNPSAAWEQINKTQKVVRVHFNPPSGPVPPDKIRIVCMSDTHSLTSSIKFEIPDGDVFIHAGDFTMCGSPQEVKDFNLWIGKLTHKHKLVIAGNHELSFDSNIARPHGVDNLDTLGLSKTKIQLAAACTNIRDFLTNATYLEDSGVTLYGINFYGSPWQPEYRKWAFNLPRGAPCLAKWNLIPKETDVLITHTPPIGHGDLCCTGIRAGCVELLSTVQNRVKPKYHIFGHIHEAYGITSDGKIIFINASTCDISYSPVNPPLTFDMSLPPGVNK